MSKRSPFDKRRDALRRLLIDTRKSKKITQIQLAEQLQKPQSFVSKYENGDRLLDLVEVHQICQALSHSFIELVSGFDAVINDPEMSYGVNVDSKKPTNEN